MQDPEDFQTIDLFKKTNHIRHHFEIDSELQDLEGLIRDVICSSSRSQEMRTRVRQMFISAVHELDRLNTNF